MDPLPKPTPSLFDPQLLWATAALIATLLLGALVFAWLDRWRKRSDRDTLTPADELTAFRLSYEQGELSQEEYERIRARLAPKIKRQLGATEKPAGSERQRPKAFPGAPGSNGNNGDAGATPDT
jgi:hypothetical protein